MRSKNRRLIIILMITTAILLFPLLAMQITDTVTWKLFDFVAAGVVLFAAGISIELILRKVKQFWYRFFLISAVFGLLFLLWAEASVGIFGTPMAGN